MAVRRPLPATRRAQLVLAVVLGLSLGLGAVLTLHLRAAGAKPAGPANPPSVSHLDLPASEPASAPILDTAVPVVAARSAPDAVRGFLAALVRGDGRASYGLLDRAGRRRFPSLARWADAQAERLQPTGFLLGPQHLAADGAVEVWADVRHRPRLDPFTGLAPGHTLEQWRAVREGRNWRVDPDPEWIKPFYPADASAPAVVRAWLAHQVACDAPGAAPLQAAAELLGPIDLSQAPCQQHGAWTAGAPVALEQATDPSPYLAAYGPSVRSWGRLVPVTGPGSSFFVVVAPLGDDWRVIGTLPGG